MGLKKKKNVIILTACMVVCFILYQLYFFIAITKENAMANNIIPMDHPDTKQLVHLRSKADENINEHGVMKGVFHQHMVKYRPDSEDQFKCLNSEQRIPFERVNDDYCDCEDETDEPSTTACPKSIFYCDTQYKKKPVSLNTVPSNKVNDGICDCCDGSDEWLRVGNKKLLTQGSLSLRRHYATECPNIC